MNMRAERGFTLIEVLISVVLLTVGVMALVGSSAMVTRMIGRGRESTFVGQKATSRLERLRQIAASTSPGCTSGSFASGSQTDAATGITETWTVPTTGNSRLVQVVLRYRTPTRTVADTVQTYLMCK